MCRSVDLLGHFELNAAGLVGDLLSPSEVEHLESDYMQTTETQFRRWLSNALQDDVNVSDEYFHVIIVSTD